MILLIDNYDSFSYNLYQLIGSLDPDIQVVRNDAVTTEDIENMSPSHIILSPGPGRPADSGICPEVIRHFSAEIPILGVCLGHQAIAEVFGAVVDYAQCIMHGKQSRIRKMADSQILKDLPDPFTGARYHSLAVRKETVPEELVITAETDDGEIMALQHREYPVYGLQFHPESILTPDGKSILKNFLAIKGENTI